MTRAGAGSGFAPSNSSAPMSTPAACTRGRLSKSLSFVDACELSPASMQGDPGNKCTSKYAAPRRRWGSTEMLPAAGFAILLARFPKMQLFRRFEGKTPWNAEDPKAMRLLATMVRVLCDRIPPPLSEVGVNLAMFPIRVLLMIFADDWLSQ